MSVSRNSRSLLAMLAMSRRRHPVLTAMLRTLTWTGHGRAWAIAVVTLALVIQYHAARFPHAESLLHSTLAAGIAWLLTKAIKVAVRRRRPFQVLENFARLTPAPNDDSFPSGHSVHFPSDIVAGALIGVLCGMGLIMLASA